MNPDLRQFLADRNGLKRSRLLRTADQLRAGHREMVEQFSPEQWVIYTEVILDHAIKMAESGTIEQVAIGELAMIGLGYAIEAITAAVEENDGGETCG